MLTFCCSIHIFGCQNVSILGFFEQTVEVFFNKVSMFGVSVLFDFFPSQSRMMMMKKKMMMLMMTIIIIMMMIMSLRWLYQVLFGSSDGGEGSSLNKGPQGRRRLTFALENQPNNCSEVHVA